MNDGEGTTPNDPNGKEATPSDPNGDEIDRNGTEGKDINMNGSNGKDINEMNLSEKGSLFTGWMMLSIAIGLFILSLSIYLYGLDNVFSNKKFPDDTDTPCYLSFLVMGIIFLILGIVYRDMAVHPELFEEENREKSDYLRKKEEWERIKKRVKEQEREREVHPTSGEDEGGEYEIDP